ncbi:MAG: hypothetical protein ND866_26435 [Pyrinomonadaceae bacterium]|nr:hypothetical protein [Pyrinomonadaceae bacterium]
MKQPRLLRLLVRQRYSVVAALAILLFALGPHFYFLYKRGAEWNGSFPLTHGDEVAYASYLNALIDGRPRRNDPYTGRDDSPERSQPESYFSIQFLPPTVLAMAARGTGVSSDQALFVLTLITSVASAVALCWMLQQALHNQRDAAVGTLIALTLGSVHLVAYYYWSGESSYNYLGFLRRYVPSAAFPFLFIFCGTVFRAVQLTDWRRRLVWIGLAGLSFSVLVYSYFYLWTAALAWFCCFSSIWLLTTKVSKTRALSTLGAVAVLLGVSLTPYSILVSHRARSTDEAVVLELTRSPDLFRMAELFGFVALLGLVYVGWRKNHRVTTETLVFTAALALTPFVVFNQQVIHGRSLQPFHYELLVVNYIATAALFITLLLVCKTQGARGQKFSRGAIYVLTFMALLSGGYQALLAGRRHSAPNFLRDSAFPATRQLATMGRSSPGRGLDTSSLILCTDATIADALSNVAPQPVLWAPHMYQFPGTNTEEDRERLSFYLYFTGVSLDGVGPMEFEQLDRARRFYIASLVSRGRLNPNLHSTWTPTTVAEIKSAVQRYADFTSTIDRARIDRYPLTYILTSAKEKIDFTNLDRWYERDAGESFKEFTLYRVRMRP